MSAIEVRDIVKKFGSFTAVNGVSFAVDEGEIFGLLGPNGAGKSTLIRMLTTLLIPTAGTARVNGFDVVTEADAVRRAIGVIPQAMTSDLELSVEENLSIFGKLYGVPRGRREHLIDELLDAVELTQWRAAPVKHLSGGMRRRVEIARGLVHEPQIFFLDEPTTGLDPVSRVAVWEMLRKIKASRGLTILLTTHYMDEADKLCDRIAIVDHGELKALDSPLKLKASIPGNNVLDVSFGAAPADWQTRLEALPEVETVSGEGEVFRISTRNGPSTTLALMEAAAAARVAVSPFRSKARPSTTSSSTTRARAPRRAPGGDPAWTAASWCGGPEVHRMWAIIERELRRFRRSPMLIVVSMVFPVVQLVVLGYAFGGNVKHLKVAVVDQDHGVPAVRVRELASAVASGARTFDTIAYADPGAALTDLRNGQRQWRPHDPAGLLPPRPRQERPPGGADRGQHRQLHLGDPRIQHGEPRLGVQPAPGGARASRRRPPSTWWRSTLTFPTSSTSSPGPSSCRSS